MNKQLLTLVIASLTFATVSASKPPVKSTSVAEYLQWRKQNPYGQKGVQVAPPKTEAVILESQEGVAQSTTGAKDPVAQFIATKYYGRGEAEKAMERKGAQQPPVKAHFTKQKPVIVKKK